MLIRSIGVQLLVFLLIFSGCNKRTSNGPDIQIPDSSRIKLEPFGSENSLEILTWNIENFPKIGAQTVTDVVEIIRDLGADIIAMQEIRDTVSFRLVLSKLPNYDGTYSNDVYGDGSYQKTAVIFKKDMVSLLDKEMLFPNDSYSFPRPPLQVYLRVQKNNRTFDFYLIVLHLKAFSSSEDQARRRQACQKLKIYLDDQLATGPEKEFIVLGDWNDSLTDPDPENVFKVFLDDPADYHFLTASLAQSPQENATYIGYSIGSVIDHILITQEVTDEYNSGTTAVIKVDKSFGAYISEVSDHRPVGAIFPLFK
ncbi:MAG: hypothetical protein Kow0042_25490 [Calditrichia bacterium]